MSEIINNLEKRIANIEAKLDESESSKLQKLAEISFKTVLDADIHLDNKASRILSAMAFLTAASSAIFAKAYSSLQATPKLQELLTKDLLPYIDAKQIPSTINSVIQDLQKPQLNLFGFDLALVSFSIYIFFVILGATVYLAALGPSLNIPIWFRNQNGIQEVKSLLFFDKIAEVNQNTWIKYWEENTQKNLQEKLLNNFISESYLIAQKAKTKVALMSFGSLCFRIALFLLPPLVAGLFTSYITELGFILIFLISMIAIFIFEKFVRP